MTTDPTRKAFETYFAGQLDFKRDNDERADRQDKYWSTQTQCRWEGWQAAMSYRMEEAWVSADERMPTFSGKVIIAQRYVSPDIPNGTWIYYTGHESEMRNEPWEACWFADDNELIPLADTWWKPIGNSPRPAPASPTRTAQ